MKHLRRLAAHPLVSWLPRGNMRQRNAWFGLALGLLIACGSDAEPELPSYTGPESVAAEIGKEGGRMELETGARVEVPADALSSKVMVELEVLDSGALPKMKSALGQGLKEPVAFRPHGQTFSRPVTIELPLKPTPAGSSVHLLWLDDEDDTEWQELKTFRLLESDADGGKVLAFETLHFSVYWPVALPDDGGGDAGVSPPTDGGTGMADGGDMLDAGGSCDTVQCAQGLICVEDAPGTTRCVAADAGARNDGGGSAIDAGVKQDAGTGGGSSDAGSDGAVDAGTQQDASAPIDAGADAGADGGASADAGADGAPSSDASATLYASCAEAFAAYPGVATDCTNDPSALGFDCEGVVGANTGLSCQQFCETFGSNCASGYVNTTFGQCGSAQTQSPVSCDAQGDYYCGCGVLP